MATKTYAGESSVYNANTNWANEEKYLQGLIDQGNPWAVDQMGILQAAKQSYTQPQTYAQVTQPTTYAQVTQPTVYTQPTENYNHSLDGGKTWITAAQSLAKQTGVSEQQAQMLLDQGRQTGTTYDVIMQQARQLASDSLYEDFIADRYASWLDLQDSPGAFVAGMPFEDALAYDGGLDQIQMWLQNGFDAKNNGITVTPLTAEKYADIISRVTGGQLDGSGYNQNLVRGMQITGANVGENGQYVKSGGVGMNPQTTTYIDEYGNKQTGYVQSAGTGSYVDSMIQQLKHTYDQQVAAADNAAAAATKQAILELERQKNSINDEYQGLYEQMYINRRMNEKALPEQLAAMGITGGLTESALLQLQNEYQNNLLQGETARLKDIRELDAAIAQAQLTGDLELANQLMEMQSWYYTQYADLMAQQNAMNQAKVEQLAENGWILLENGQMPEPELLEAMGLTAAQAQALLGSVNGNPVPVTKDLGTLYSSLNSMVGQLISRGRSQEYIDNYLAQAISSGGLTAEGMAQIISNYGIQ